MALLDLLYFYFKFLFAVSPFTADNQSFAICYFWIVFYRHFIAAERAFYFFDDTTSFQGNKKSTMRFAKCRDDLIV